jgi:hypothetical protein
MRIFRGIKHISSVHANVKSKVTVVVGYGKFGNVRRSFDAGRNGASTGVELMA